ncbi:CsgG/HfaB family protein [Vitiosangium sp. GDMCC 1.1324]|uniref:CsgG/HfaB family protein n=1 Tax=Vitiosangium sp. (strain GDMCC 1.1324) TaxID=2138576 RepID=UPI00130D89CA|nr:CsgG/HfaB family protein [Vitiosangium sp. GDMCC 1.1324]
MKTLRSSLTRLAVLLLGLLTLPVLAADKPTVAVLYFDYEGDTAGMKLLKKGLAQMLISDLSAHESVRLVERERLQQVLDELKLNQSDKFDPETANRIGKLLGARYLVMGGYFDVMNTLRVDARVVETETGRIIRSVGADSTPDRFLTLEQTLAQDLRAVFEELTATAEPGKAPAKPKPARGKPRRLTRDTALRYARALDAKDRKDLETAKKELTAVVKAQPDFQLASTELALLMK